MLTKVHKCHKCGSSKIVKNGHTRKGSARYKCKGCGVTRVLESDEMYSDKQKDLVIKTYQERASLRGVGRIFGISHQTVLNWVKKN